MCCLLETSVYVSLVEILRARNEADITGPLCTCIEGFLHDHTVCVHVNQYLLTPCSVAAELSHGSLLSPILFNMAMVALPKCLPQDRHRLYLAIFTYDVLWCYGPSGEATRYTARCRGGEDLPTAHGRACCGENTSLVGPSTSLGLVYIWPPATGWCAPAMVPARNIPGTNVSTLTRWQQSCSRSVLIRSHLL